MATQSRNPKRARKKEGQQRRREAELAAMKRQRRTSQIKRAAVFGVLLLISLFVVTRITGDDKKATDVAADGSTTTVAGESTTTVAAGPVTSCPVEGDLDAALGKKPTIDVPAEPATALQKEDLVVGTGAEVPEGATVSVRYVGVSQSTGKEFDASWDRGCDPYTTSLDQVVAGWTQGIPGMKVGGRRLLTIPGDMGYGEAGRPPDIGKNETLVFVVDVLEIVPPAGDTTTTAGDTTTTITP
jgi:peptidylprolyl isomerase